MSTIEKPAARKIASKTSWLKSGVHTITLETGHDVKIKIPNLATLIRLGVVPVHLRSMAVRAAKGEAPLSQVAAGEELPDDSGEEAFLELQKVVELLDFLILEMVVEPKLTQEDVDQMPAEDRELLVAIAQREREFDAVGRRLGVDPLSRWETFRHRHDCPEDCRACEASRRDLSTTDLGDM